MEKIVELIRDWEYPRKMPRDWVDFQKEIPEELGILNDAVIIFTYKNIATHCSVEAIYNVETEDFMVRCRKGFHDFFDIRFIRKEIKEFELVIELFFCELLKELRPDIQVEKGFFVERKGLLKWNPKNLPEKHGTMELYIRPRNYFSTVNGGVVLLDYSSFVTNNQFVLFYNRMRDDFYAECRVIGEILRISEYDCSTLEELDVKLEGLLDSLDKIEKK